MVTHCSSNSEAQRTFKNLSPGASNATKIGIGNIWDVWCKMIQCLVMGDLKQIRISFKIFDHYMFTSGIERSFVKP